MTRNIIADLRPLIRVKAKDLVEQLLEVGVVTCGRARKPTPSQHVVELVEWDRASEDFGHIERAPNRVAEHLRAGNAFHPTCWNRAIE